MPFPKLLATPLLRSSGVSKVRINQLFNILSVCCLVGLGILPDALKPKPALSADAVKVSYGPLEFSLSTDSLETFAETGKVTGDLAFYAKFLNPKALVELRQFLQRRFEVAPVVISQLTYSPMGERVFQKPGDIIRTDSRQNGLYAFRAALILAAADPQGMTVLNIIHHYPVVMHSNGKLVDQNF